MKKTACHTDSCIDVHRDAWLDSLRSRKYSPASIQNYQTALNKFAFFLAAQNRTRLQDITSDDIEAYQRTLIDEGLSENTCEGYLSTVRAFFAWLAEGQHIFVNPTEHLQVGRARRALQPVPSEDDIGKLFSQPDLTRDAGIRDRAWLEVLYSTGIRFRELIRLDITDVDFKQARLRVQGKGNKQRTVPLGKQAKSWTQRYVKAVRPKLLKENPDELALWLGVNGGRRINPQQIQVAIRNYGQAARCSVPITAHALRRACATHMLQGGAHPVAIQMLLGHSTLQTLSQYLRVTITELKQLHAKSKPGR